MSNKPTNQKLYDKVKKLANKKFESKTGIYRSSWIVKEYVKRGGKYSGQKKESGLKRWFAEKWVNLNSPIKKNGEIIGYKKCGRKNTKDTYPLCRPSKRVSRKTPRTYHEISKKSLSKAKKAKSKVKGSKNIQFGKGAPQRQIQHDDTGIFSIVASIIAISFGASFLF
jgi:hypothetical protein